MDGTTSHFDATQSSSERKGSDHSSQAFHAHAHFMQDPDAHDQEDDVVYEDVVDIDDTMGADEGDRSASNSANSGRYYFGDDGAEAASHGASLGHPTKSGKRLHSEALQSEEEEVVRELLAFFDSPRRARILFPPFPPLFS